MISPGIWRYWNSESNSRIAPDLDDTCCASFLLRKIHPSVLRDENIMFLLRNRNENGLFYTWLNPLPGHGEQNDIDSVVNGNVILYLGEREETKKTISFLNRIVLEDREEGTYWYYLNHLALYYMLSRAYFNGVKSLHPSADFIIRKITSKQDQNGSFGDELNTALAISTLLNYNFSDSTIFIKGVEFLLDSQIRTGMWKKRAFYAGPQYPSPHSVWFGAEALTTALCLEALLRIEETVAS
jgi:squalene cyclase